MMQYLCLSGRKGSGMEMMLQQEYARDKLPFIMTNIRSLFLQLCFHAQLYSYFSLVRGDALWN